jgi:hypothetical protein
MEASGTKQLDRPAALQLLGKSNMFALPGTAGAKLSLSPAPKVCQILNLPLLINLANFTRFKFELEPCGKIREKDRWSGLNGDRVHGFLSPGCSVEQSSSSETASNCYAAGFDGKRFLFLSIYIL